MTIEELQEKLDAALASIAKLETKNKELQTEKQRAKTEADEAREAAEAAAEEKARSAKDVEALEASLTKKYQKQIETLTTERDKAAALNSKLLIDNGITALLDQHKVAPQWKRAAMLEIKDRGVQVIDGAAVVEGKALADFAAEFFSSDAGKLMVAAPVNGGGGSTGSATTTATAWATPPKTGQDYAEFGKLMNENPDLANNLADKWGMPGLKA